MSSNIKVTVGKVSGKSEYEVMSDLAVENLAKNIVNEEAFASWQVPADKQHFLAMIFLPLSHLSPIEKKIMKRDKIVHVYGLHSDLGLRAVIDGMPLFTQIRFLTEEDSRRVRFAITQVSTEGSYHANDFKFRV
jgi:hypothetical protein